MITALIKNIILNSMIENISNQLKLNFKTFLKKLKIGSFYNKITFNPVPTGSNGINIFDIYEIEAHNCKVIEYHTNPLNTQFITNTA